MTTLNREQLYEQVWSKPMIKLAKEYGLSNNGLRKICRKFDIPIPQSGYWQKLQFGKPVKKAPLPPYKGEDKIEIQERIKVFGGDKDSLPPEIAAEYLPENQIKVQDRLVNPHPLIKNTQKTMREGGWQSEGWVFSGDEGFNIRVTRKSLNRTLRILDALIKALDERKLEVFIKESKTYVRIFEETIEFRLYELEERVKKEKKEAYGADYELIPTGRLMLSIEGVWDIRSRWKDGDKQKLEEMLNDFIIGLYRAAFKDREWRIKREKEAAEREEKQRKLEELRRQQEIELKKFQALEGDAGNWQRSQIIKSFIEAKKFDYLQKNGEIEAGSDFENWLKWANQKASLLNPL